jgi:hypothetical protein
MPYVVGIAESDVRVTVRFSVSVGSWELEVGSWKLEVGSCVSLRPHHSETAS